MKPSFILPLLIFAMITLAPANANERSITVETSIYEWVEEAPLVQPTTHVALGQYGPFTIVTRDRAELNGSIEYDTPAQFRAMLAAFPGISQIDMIECPGTGDDEANLEIAHMIRSHGITTNVPDGGSVRSGGVELFLAGARRMAAPTAEFAVHSWRDEDGLEASDYADDDPANQEYIQFYRQMGMNDAKARAFYAMTSNVPHDSALYLNSRDIAAFIPLD